VNGKASKTIDATFRGIKDTVNMYLAEGNDISRRRAPYIEPDFSSDAVFTIKYDIDSIWDTHPEGANLKTKTDLTKVTHFIFQGSKLDWYELVIFGGRPFIFSDL